MLNSFLERAASNFAPCPLSFIIAIILHEIRPQAVGAKPFPCPEPWIGVSSFPYIGTETPYPVFMRCSACCKVENEVFAGVYSSP